MKYNLCCVTVVKTKALRILRGQGSDAFVSVVAVHKYVRRSDFPAKDQSDLFLKTSFRAAFSNQLELPTRLSFLAAVLCDTLVP